MLEPINAVGALGVVSDQSPSELPLNCWNDASNVRFLNNRAEKMKGYVSIFGTPSIVPYYAQNYLNDTTNLWLYLGTAKAYAWDGGVHTNVTRQSAGVDVDYAMDTGYGWQGCFLSGVAIVNNGVDVPQAWLAPSPGQKLQDLPNWPATDRCQIIRTYKQFLIALNITKSGSNFPQLVKWSHPADPGSVPVSWDETDPTKLAGESPKLSETSGFIIDGATLRDTFVIYKEDSVWGMQVVSNSEVFRIFKIFGTGGIMSKDCVVEYNEGRHVVFGIDDIYMHDGQQMKSIVSNKTRDRVFGSINGDEYKKCHIVHSRATREIFFCYPTEDETFCTEAMIWNYENNTCGFMTLPKVSSSVSGIVNLESTSDQWGVDPQVWGDDTTRWNERLYNPTSFQVVAVSPENTQIFMIGFSNSDNGTASSAFIERKGLALPAISKRPPDMTYRKFVRRVWPRIEGTPGAVVKIQVGTQEDNLDEVNWRPAQDFIIGQSRAIDCRVAGRLFAIRFLSDTILTWKLHGYEIEYELAGRY